MFEDSIVSMPSTASEPDLEQCGIQRVAPSHGRVDHMYWVAGALGFVLVVLGLGVSLFTDRGNEAVASEKSRETGNVRAVTHQVLMGERDLAALDETPPLPAVESADAPRRAADARRAPLPELVTVDRLLAVEGPPAPKKVRHPVVRPPAPRKRRRRNKPGRRPGLPGKETTRGTAAR